MTDVMMDNPFSVPGQLAEFCGPGACSLNEANDKLALLWERYDAFGVDWLVSGVAAGATLTKTKGELKRLFAEDQGVGYIDPVLGAMTYSDTSQFAKNGALTNACAAFIVAAMRFQPGVLYVNNPGAGQRKSLSYFTSTAFYHSELNHQLFEAVATRFISEYQGCQKETGPMILWQSPLGIDSGLLARNGTVRVQYPATATRCLFVIPNSQVNDNVDLQIELTHDLQVEVEAASVPTTTQTVIQMVRGILEGFAVPASQGLCGPLEIKNGQVSSLVRG